MSIKHAILGLLVDGPRHGYDIKLAYEQELAPQVKLNAGQVYTTLDRLSDHGQVQSEKVEQDPRPDKIVYRLTPQGESELQQWLGTPTRYEMDLRNETFLKINLARRLDNVDPIGIIAQERRACFEKLHEASGARDQVQKTGEDLASLMLLDLAVLRLEAFIHWLDRCEELLTVGANRE